MKYCILNKNDKLSNDIKEKLLNDIKLTFDNINPDIVIAVGGDGTFIDAVHKYPNSIFFGIHTGHLGFYANYTVNCLNDLINDINNSNYKLDQIDILNCEIKTKSNLINTFAINELTIISPPKTLILDVLIDDNLFEKFRGTGMCVSTAYGSTAYNKSLNGAVIDSSIKSLQITEIAGINSNEYRTLGSPLLLAGNRKISFKCNCEEDIFITVDNISYNLNDFNSLDITLCENKIKIGHNNENDFLSRIGRAFLKE